MNKFDKLYFKLLKESSFEGSEYVKNTYIKYAPSVECSEDFFERYSKFIVEALLDFSKGNERMRWTLIPAARLTRIWLDFGRTGVIRDEKGLDNIKEIMLNNIVKLRIGTEMQGHGTIDPKNVISDNGFEDDINLDNPEVNEKWYWKFFETPHGPILSDYGLPKLEEIYPSIYMAKTAEECAYAIDKALNVIHMRSDLSNLFIEGGKTTLNKIATQI